MKTNLLYAALLFALIAAANSAQAQLPEPQCPGGSNPDPNVVFCENFESKSVFLNKGNPSGWENVSEYCCDHNGSGTVDVPPSEETEMVAGGNTPNAWGTTWPGITGFNSTFTAWNEQTPSSASGHYAEHTIPPGNEYYFRWYTYLSNPFIPGNIQDKNFRVRSPDQPRQTGDPTVNCVTVTVMVTVRVGVTVTDTVLVTVTVTVRVAVTVGLRVMV